MFDIFAQLLSSVISFLFPIFASYKALKTADPAELTPWLMYWVVLACALLVESWLEWFLVWIPFYAYLRLLLLLYLVLPQTQGARIIYQERVHPWLEDNETAIEEFIATSHDRLKSAGIAYLNRAIEVIKTSVFGLPPSEPPAAASEPTTPQSYTQALLRRFSLPSARWSGAPTSPSAPGNMTANELYSLLASSFSAATTASATTAGGQPKAAEAKDLQQHGVYSSVGSLVPSSIRNPAARMSFLATQRDRLNMIISALDREATQLQNDESERHNTGHSSASLNEPSSAEEQAQTGLGAAAMTTRPPSGQSAFSVLSGLSKSRSEPDFEKLEAESGAEEDMDEPGGVRKRSAPAARGGNAGWASWGWSTGTAGTSSGVDND